MKILLILVLFLLSCTASLSEEIGEIYCTKASLCYRIPEGFHLITKEFSEAMSTEMRRLLPGQNLGLYEDLYRIFYENKLFPYDRAYIAIVGPGSLFLAIYSQSVNEQNGPLGNLVSHFEKMGIFRSGPWPTEKVSQQRLQEALTAGMKNRLMQQNSKTGITSVGGKLLWFSSDKKYIALERSVDVNDEVLKKHMEASVPSGKGVVKDCLALQFSEKGLVFINFFCAKDSIDKYYPILKDVLEGVR